MGNKFNKSFQGSGLKSYGITADTTMLAKINSFALQKLPAEQIYIRRYLVAHSVIDRDNERFSPEVLKDFKKSLLGKSLLVAHNRTSLPIGLFFDAFLDTVSAKGFLELTGEFANLPGDEDLVHILWAYTYMLKTPDTEELIQKIESGIVRYVSIGFKAADLISKTINGVSFQEYQSPAEAIEGSLVWLGAQQGAMVKEDKNTPVTTNEEENFLVPLDEKKSRYEEKLARYRNKLIPEDEDGLQEIEEA
jgi:hypothetical protein